MRTDSVDREQKLDALAIGLLFILCVSWGLQQVAIKVAIQSVPPLLQCGIRSGGAFILVLIWMLARKEQILEKDGTLWWGIAAGLLFAGEFMLVYWGPDFTLASRAGIFLYLSPFVVALGSQWFIPGENLTITSPWQWCTVQIFSSSHHLAEPTKFENITRF